jgi:GNAT superfamily N-acetyltransferase
MPCMLRSIESPDVQIREFGPDDQAAVLDCMQACFNFRPDAAAWRHLMLNNPVGPPIIMLALHCGLVVAQVAVLPRRIHAFGQIGIAGHSIDSMTRPEWRRRGLRRALATRARELGCQRGILATFGYSNRSSLSGILRHDERRLVGPLPVLVRPLRPCRTAASMVKRRWSDRLRGPGHDRESGDAIPDSSLAQVASWQPAVSPPAPWQRTSFTDGHTALFREAEGIAPIALVRDMDLLAWRYQTGKSHALYLQQDAILRDELVATIVIRFAYVAGIRLVMVMEWFWRRGCRESGEALLSSAVELAKITDAQGVAALAAPRSLQRGLLVRHGFLPVPAASFPKTTMLSVRLEDRTVDPSPWLDRANWYTTWGDGYIL